MVQEKPDWERIARATKLAGSIDRVIPKRKGWRGRLEVRLKRFLKWLVHWNTGDQAEFNRLMVESSTATLGLLADVQKEVAGITRHLSGQAASGTVATDTVGNTDSGAVKSRITEKASIDQAEIKRWIEDTNEWPTADSYQVATLRPSPVLERREEVLRQQVPGWFWQGEPGAALLSIGTGKGYFERKYWGRFDRIYIIDSSEKTRSSLMHFGVPNAEFLSTSLFHVSPRLKQVPRHCWLGSCIHYLFGEFHGWAFMEKLAMMVSDTVVIDAGVFDLETPQGQYLMGKWQGFELHDHYTRPEFSYDRFRGNIEGLWEVTSERETAWINDGRRSIILARVLPPVIQKADLGDLELIVDGKTTDNVAVYRSEKGYYKKSGSISSLLMYQVVSRAMGWHDMVRWRVYDGSQYVGFVAKDYGNQTPDDPAVSESLLVSILNWALPMGLLPADVARGNVRVNEGRPVWIDITLVGLREMDASGALWAVTNTYKQYHSLTGLSSLDHRSRGA